jgi:uncharacterized protein (TIGR02679 family)
MIDDNPDLPPDVTSPALLPLWRALHDRFSSGRAVSAVRVDGLDHSGRAALADLLGLDHFPRTVVALHCLDAVLVEIAGRDTREVVRALVGEIEDRAGRRADALAARRELWDWLRGHAVVRAQPALDDWVEGLRRSGTGSVPAMRALLEAAVTVLDGLPADGRPLPVFASDVLGDPHALDDGTRLAGVVLRALAVVHGVPVPTSAEERRGLWERVGVAEDELSATVLVAGVRPAGRGLVPVILRSSADEGHAASLTLAQLRAVDRWELPTNGVVHVVENPSIIALALTRFGRFCPPVVCTAGWPSGAGILLLRGFASAGQEIRYHGDLDGDGVRIASYVIAKVGARPWRMSAADYRLAVRPEGPAVGRVTAAPWDADLGPEMAQRGVAVVEEQMSGVLLAELAASG